MKIAVMGAGGVGGYFGGRLAAGGAEVSLVARGAHLEALKRDGLHIRSPKGDLHVVLPATSDPAEIGPVDVVLFCVKSTDTESAARELAPLLGDDTVVVTLQNGVDNEEKIEAILGEGRAAGGVAYIMATIGEPGTIVHEGPMARIVFGELDGGRSPRLEALETLCRASGVDAKLSDDVRFDLWRKMAFICAVASMTASARLPVGGLRESEPAVAMLARLAREVVTVAERKGVALSEDIPLQVVETVRALPAENYSSLHYDLTHGKPLELEALNGAIVRFANELGLSVPANEAVYAILHPWALRNA